MNEIDVEALDLAASSDFLKSGLAAEVILHFITRQPNELLDNETTLLQQKLPDCREKLNQRRRLP
ncbi:hypothetical protein QCD60_21810 [Pokkaliibacter sp. MBI-7]|uniref:hypothetical protein n=1 Tax=Pokkaliibacter sp. MBI-7 TaxID=3040600 RepID=UPI0024485213|nr:hypothetical protein [Pokkaliibacter sp. MBI-7]MDH2435165.1 hypothetical protein [Pokkaliibacter sp. MBI-7]